MSNRVPMTNSLKPWLAEFFFIRGLFGGADGRPLYSYQVTAEEFINLEIILKRNKGLAVHPVYMQSWAAGYCLYVAERYRRYYDGGAGGWSWQFFDEKLTCEFNPQTKATIVEKGLVGYWHRSIRGNEQGRDFLGSLFVEGGLPWILVQSENHGFGRAVRRGLKHSYSNQRKQNTISDVLAMHESELPQAFRNMHTRQLLSGIVEQLVELVQQHELEKKIDPSSYLDEANPEWRTAFPIPLDEANARSLINDWLILAGNQRKLQAETIGKSIDFSSEHILVQSEGEWCLRAEVMLPKEYLFEIDKNDLTSTRLQICLYEDDTVLVRSAFVYGQIEECGVRVRFPQTRLSVLRKDPELQLSLSLIANGQTILNHIFDNSEFDLTNAPLIFAEVDDEQMLVGNESCSLFQSIAQVRLPPGSVCEPAIPEALSCEPCGAQWYELNESIEVTIDSERYRIRIGQQTETSEKPFIEGVYRVLSHSNPKAVYLGWPRLVLPSSSSLTMSQLTEFVNRTSKQLLEFTQYYGLIHYRVKDSNQCIVLRRTFGVLPRDFSLSVFPSHGQHPATIIVRSSKNLVLEIHDPSLTYEIRKNEGEITVNVRYTGEETAVSINLNIRSENNPNPITLKIPYPVLGARLYDDARLLLGHQNFILQDLLGKRILLSSGGVGFQRFNVHLKLIGALRPQPTIYFSVMVKEFPVEISLYNYQKSIEQLLASASDQDAYVQFTISSGTQLLDFNVRRYNGILEKVSRDKYSLKYQSLSGSTDRVMAEAMLLSDPRRTPVTLPARRSEGVHTGQFEIPHSMEKYSPWMIYPTENSSVRFRPVLHLGSDSSGEPEFGTKTLHRACQIFHPFNNPFAFSDPIKSMSVDLDHSGWQYLADLMLRYSHLPLSSFEVWKALASNQEALAVAIYRLDMDEANCERIRDELSTLWECISLGTWTQSHKRYVDWMYRNRLPQSLISSVEENRMSILSEVVPGFRDFGEYISSGDISKLPKIPPPESIFPLWYQSLRRNHESDERWPTDLALELVRWIELQALPREIKILSSVQYSDAVTYLPVFMAHVTVGLNSIDELHTSQPYLKYAIRLLSDFDRLGWYNCVHGVMVTHLLKQATTEGRVDEVFQ